MGWTSGFLKITETLLAKHATQGIDYQFQMRIKKFDTC